MLTVSGEELILWRVLAAPTGKELGVMTLEMSVGWAVSGFLGGLLCEVLADGRLLSAFLPRAWERYVPAVVRRDTPSVKDAPPLSPPSSILKHTLSFPSPLFFSLPSCSLPHLLSGRAMPEGPSQRVMAAAEASSSDNFHSESGFHFWGQGWAELFLYRLTACRLWRGTSMG